MAKKNRHINKYLSYKLPEPEIPADDAWADMNGMLNSVNGTTPAGKTLLSGLKLPLLTLLGVTLSGILIFKFAFNPKSSGAKTELRVTERSFADSTTKEQQYSYKQDATIQNPEKSEVSNLTELSTTTMDSAVRESKKITVLPESSEPFSPNKKAITAQPEKRLPAENERNYNFKNNKKHKQQQHTSEKAERALTQNISNRRRISGGRMSSLEPQKNSKSGDNESNSYSPNALSQTSSKPVPDIRNNFKVNKLNLAANSFRILKADLQKLVKIPSPNKTPAPIAPEKTRSLHFGLEWSLISPFKKTDYLFTGKDSTNKPAALLIPALVISKSWQSHQLTLSAAAQQSYFGNNQVISEVADSTIGDSAIFFFRTNFLKATGLNFSLQYHYRFAGAFSAGAGVSYAIFSNALARQATRNWASEIRDGALIVLRDKEQINEFLKPRQVAMKVGLLYSPGRFQVGANVILPFTNISRSSEFKVRQPNGQFFVRFMVW